MATGNAWKRERVAKGLCSGCDKPLSPKSKWWCEDHLEKRRLDSAARRTTNPKLLQDRSHISVLRARIRVMVKLGGLRCAWCGEHDYRVLSIDHVNGRGDTDKGKRGFSTLEIYAIERGELPLSDYRVLCMNCQNLHEYGRGNRTIYPEVRDAVIAAGGMIGGESDA